MTDDKTLVDNLRKCIDIVRTHRSEENRDLLLTLDKARKAMQRIKALEQTSAGWDDGETFYVDAMAEIRLIARQTITEIEKHMPAIKAAKGE